jgi:uncharacterized protein (TIRG00374 family)
MTLERRIARIVSKRFAADNAAGDGCYPPPVMVPPAPSARRRRLSPFLRIALQLLVIGLAGWAAGATLGSVGWRELAASLRDVDPAWTALSVLLLVARFVVWDLRWRIAFRPLGEAPGPLHTFFALLGSACANTIIPVVRVVGGLLRARYVSHAADQSFGRAYGVVLFDQLAHQTVIVITGWLAFAGMAWVLGQRVLGVVAFAALVLCGLLVDLWVRRLRRERNGRFEAWMLRRVAALEHGRAQTVVQHGRDAVAVLRDLLSRPQLRRQAMLLGVLYVLLNAAAQWAVFQAMDRSVDLLTVGLAVTAGIAAGGFTGTPGGVGTTEAGMVLAYVALDVPRLDAAAGTVLFRGLHYLVVIGLGLPALLVFEARLRRFPKEAAE